MLAHISEASLGKGYLRELGVPTSKKRPWALPPETQGAALTTYYGGRSEVTIRQTPVEVIYCDFKSQYPTVNTLMGLQAFWIAGDVTTREVTDEVAAFLAQPIPDLLRTLQQPATWQRLRVIVKLAAHDDLVPARAKYNKITYNIGQAYVKGRYQLWYTLADVLASRTDGQGPKDRTSAPICSQHRNGPDRPHFIVWPAHSGPAAR